MSLYVEASDNYPLQRSLRFVRHSGRATSLMKRQLAQVPTCATLWQTSTSSTTFWISSLAAGMTEDGLAVLQF